MSPHPGGPTDGDETDETDEAVPVPPTLGPTTHKDPNGDAADHEEEEEDEDEEEEPKLKYASLTRAQGTIYRNGDAASSFLVTGDKMVGAACLGGSK